MKNLSTIFTRDELDALARATWQPQRFLNTVRFDRVVEVADIPRDLAERLAPWSYYRDPLSERMCKAHYSLYEVDETRFTEAAIAAFFSCE